MEKESENQKEDKETTKEDKETEKVKEEKPTDCDSNSKDVKKDD